jgi:hypothetical protein
MPEPRTAPIDECGAGDLTSNPPSAIGFGETSCARRGNDSGAICIHREHCERTYQSQPGCPPLWATGQNLWNPAHFCATTPFKDDDCRLDRGLLV